MNGPLRVRPDVNEAGFTLIELIIYVSLSVLILSLVGGFLLNGVRAERDVTSAAQAANTAQLIAESIKRDVRNATEIRVNDDHNLLVVRTAGMDETFALSCRSWYFDSATHAIYSVNEGAATEPTTTDPWTVRGEGISPIDGVPVFSRFGVSGAPVQLSFIVNGATPVVVSTSVTPRAIFDNEGSCFAD